MGYQTTPHGSLGLPCRLYQFMSLAEGTALLFLSPNGFFNLPSAPHPPQSAYDITGTEKNYLQLKLAMK